MSTQWTKALAALSLFPILAGCSKSHSSALTPLSDAEVKPVIQQSFADASAETKAEANDVIQSMQSHDMPGALEDLQHLRMSKGLSQEQQMAIARAVIATTRNLQAAADAGDQKAAAVLHAYKMNH